MNSITPQSPRIWDIDLSHMGDMDMSDITMVQKDEKIIGTIEIDHDLQAVYYRRREADQMVDGSCMDLYGKPAQEIINQLFH